MHRCGGHCSQQRTGQSGHKQQECSKCALSSHLCSRHNNNAGHTELQLISCHVAGRSGTRQDLQLRVHWAPAGCRLTVSLHQAAWMVQAGWCMTACQ